MQDKKTFLHSGARGDIIYGLPAIKCLGGGIFYIKTDSLIYNSRVIDIKDVLWFKELLIGQDYIDDVRQWKPEVKIDYDLDSFRSFSDNSNLLSQSHLDAFNLTFDLSKPWIDGSKFEPDSSFDIIVNRSGRYQGAFDWGELREWQDRCLFVGLENEYNNFVKATGLANITYKGECSYRELVNKIIGSKLFIGNQSFTYALAEAIKHPRVLEVFPLAPNCMPQSSNGFTRLTQKLLRHFLFDEPYEKEKSLFYQNVYSAKRVKADTIILPNISYLISFNCKDIMIETKLKRERVEVLWNFDYDNYEKNIEKLAEKAKGKVICVVDLNKIRDYLKVRRIAEFLLKRDGITGILQKDNLQLEQSCFAVSRKVYEEYGLFGALDVEKRKYPVWNIE